MTLRSEDAHRFVDTDLEWLGEVKPESTKDAGEGNPNHDPKTGEFSSGEGGGALKAASPSARYLDLQRQGFMKPIKSAPVKTKLPNVACNGCMNWHPLGKHTASAAERKINLAKSGEKLNQRIVE